MADLYAGPNVPCQKRSSSVVGKLSQWTGCLTGVTTYPTGLRQQSLHDQLQSVCFIAAALDCSTKSRAREIPRDFGDGRPPPRPLRSEQHPLGLPELTGSQYSRVEKDNAAASFVLSEIDQLVDRGSGSVRRTHTTASIGGRRMKLACGIVVGGQTSGTQHVALEVPGRSCNALGTTLQKSHNGPGLTATTFMTHRNGSHGSKTANGITHPLRSRVHSRTLLCDRHSGFMVGGACWSC